MDSLLRLLVFALGAFFLGVTATLAGLCAIARRTTPEDNGEGCLGTLLVLAHLGVAGGFFYLAARLG